MAAYPNPPTPPPSASILRNPRYSTMATTPITTAADTVAYHRDRSWHFWGLVDDELARGELEEASNKLWGAAAHAIKAAAETRGWPHNAHALLEESVDRLIHEAGAPMHIRGQYFIASAYHRRFYGNPPDAESIRNGKDLIAEFIRTLESLPDTAPVRETPV